MERNVLLLSAAFSATLLIAFVFCGAWYGLRLNQRIPVWASPPVVLLGAPLVAAIGYLVGASLGIVDSQAYLSLVTLSTLGVVFGATTGGVVSLRSSVRRTPIVSPNVWTYGLALTGLAAALVYFAGYGSPLSASNVEVARASAESGYLRVLAHLTIPGALIANAFRTRGRAAIAIAAFGTVLLFGNRSPLIYLLGALVVSTILRRKWENRISEPTRQPSHPRSFLLLLAGVFATATILLGGAVLRVVLTPDYRNYDEYSELLQRQDYAAMGLWSLRHYAHTVGNNALLTQELVDDEDIPLQWGRSYFSGMLTVLPGEQLTLDLRIKEAMGSTFIGGGIPPTLAGEGYVNFGPIGPLVSGMVVGHIFVVFARRSLRPMSALDWTIYGYVCVYFLLAQVAGLAGASPLPLIMLLVLLGARNTTLRPELRPAERPFERAV